MHIPFLMMCFPCTGQSVLKAGHITTLHLTSPMRAWINLRLKTITSRPSHFQRVELANFISYLDIVVRGLEGQLYAHRQQEPVQYRKIYVCQRATEMEEQLKDIALYEEQSVEERPLKNLLCLCERVELWLLSCLSNFKGW